MAIISKKSKTDGVRYLVRVRDPLGKWFPSQTFNRKVDAERYERELLLKRDRGGSAASSELREMTLADYWKRWSAECRSRVGEGWRTTQNRNASKYVLPYLGNRKLREIKSSDIGLFMGAMEKYKLSPQSIMHLYNLLHKMFEDAVEYYEFVELNPVKKRFRPQIHRVEREFLSPADSWKLLEVSKDHFAGMAIWVALLSGLRPGEIQALRWSAIDFDRSQILIRATFNKKVGKIQDHPKQKDWGRAPMPKVLSDFLKDRSKGKRADDFVCPNDEGGMLSYESFVRQVLPRLCAQAGVKRVTPHELRHSCTELYVQVGASAEDLRRLLNHKSLSATIRYMHRTDERLQGIASQIVSPKNELPPEPEVPSIRHLKLVR